MKIEADNPDHYVEQLPEDRQEAISRLREVIKANLPGDGFEETMSYGMIGYVVPHSKYPDGYHCSPELPLPFMNIASQKNYIAVYHSGIYADEDIMAWFKEEYPKHTDLRLDMGKSCIRFRKPDKIPFDLIGELSTKLTADEWIEMYERNIKR